MSISAKNKTPIIEIDASGTITKLEITDSKELGLLEVGKDVFSIIDASTLRKLAMYDNFATLLRTKLKKFPYAYLRIFANGAKREMILLENTAQENFKADAAERLLQDYEILDTDTCSDILELLDKLIVQISEEKSILVGTKVNVSQDGSFFANVSDTRMIELLLSNIVLLSKIGVPSMLEIEVAQNGELKISADTKSFKFIDTIDKMIREFPHLIHHIMLIERICEDEAIELEILFRQKISLKYKIPTSKNGKLTLKGHSLDIEQKIKSIISKMKYI